jgi:hypothetical protein
VLSGEILRHRRCHFPKDTTGNGLAIPQRFPVHADPFALAVQAYLNLGVTSVGWKVGSARTLPVQAPLNTPVPTAQQPISSTHKMVPL